MKEIQDKFFEKIYNKDPKIHCFALKLYTGASKSGGRGGLGPRGPLDLLVGIKFNYDSGLQLQHMLKKFLVVERLTQHCQIHGIRDVHIFLLNFNPVLGCLS